jgi:anti-sigma factor ChrR (cupin superfamily)
MSTHVKREQLDGLRDGTLPPAEVAAVGRHAMACETCGKAVGESLSMDRMMRDLRIQIEAGQDVEHLSQDALMAFADGMLHGEEREAARVHLEECGICRSELEEIDRLKSLIRPRRRWAVYAIAASLAAIALILPLLNRQPETPIPTPRHTTSSNPVVTQPPTDPETTGYGRKDWDRWVAEAKRGRQLPMPAIVAALRPPQTQLRGTTEDDDLQLRPNHVVVASSRPRLQWEKREGASYNVVLQIGEQIVESGALTDPAWTPAIDLKRGREYAWQVETTIGGVRSIYPKAPDPPARFRVLEQSALDEIDDARKRYPEDHLLQAVLFARYGLRDEAMDALDRLGRSDAALAAALRESLRKW